MRQCQLLMLLSKRHETASKLLNIIEDATLPVKKYKKHGAKGSGSKLESVAKILKSIFGRAIVMPIVIVFMFKGNCHADNYRVHVQEAEVNATDIFKDVNIENGSPFLANWFTKKIHKEGIKDTQLVVLQSRNCNAKNIHRNGRWVYCIDTGYIISIGIISLIWTGVVSLGPSGCPFNSSFGIRHETASKLIDIIADACLMVEEYKKQGAKGSGSKLESAGNTLKSIFRISETWAIVMPVVIVIVEAFSYKMQKFFRPAFRIPKWAFQGKASMTLSWRYLPSRNCNAKALTEMGVGSIELTPVIQDTHLVVLQSWNCNSKTFTEMGIESIELTSGTLSPLDSFAQELKFWKILMSSNQIWTGVASLRPSVIPLIQLFGIVVIQITNKSIFSIQCEIQPLDDCRNAGDLLLNFIV
ncbi:hypothetical protein V6N12_023126 [Hibiscus sabdariffa]|uniref:Uncharacterized protein n=1 Tax=Hibiscus sabdariffa TaxID=183260 RepID=A0ABR2FX67_9ROSI